MAEVVDTSSKKESENEINLFDRDPSSTHRNKEESDSLQSSDPTKQEESKCQGSAVSPTEFNMPDPSCGTPYL